MYGGLSECERRIIGKAHSSTEAWSNLEILCDDYGGKGSWNPREQGSS
ncbi:MAG: hypothetical protein ACLFVP_06480 [Candidatus Bathyarchaeia archaeon]